MIVTAEKAGQRLDAAIAELTELSRSAAQKLLEEGGITVNGQAVKKNYKTVPGDEISLQLPEPEPLDVAPENLPLDVVFEDEDVIVINKPKGLVVHPATGHWSGTLVNALLYHCGDSLSGINGELRPGIVHRIDKDTSGLLAVAKNDLAHVVLASQLKDHTMARTYECIVCGNLKEDSGTVDAPIGRHPVDRKKMAVLLSDDAHAKEAITHYEVLERYGEVSYLKLYLETGRTHQIRVHMAYLGHALLGDEVYATTKTRFEKLHAPLFSGQMLHAKRLSFIHPTTGERVEFECEMPDNFKRAVELLRLTSEN